MIANPKARIVGWTLIDLVVDAVVPTLVALALTAAGTATFLALTAGGVLVGAKAALGRIEDWRADRRTAGVATAAVVALVVLVGLTAAGAPDVVAAAVAGVVIALPLVAVLVGRGRLDGFGLLVLAELVASVVLTLASDDPRFLLARPAVYTLVAGIYALTTCRWGRPLMLDATKPVAAAGDPVRAEAFEAAWAHSTRFRRIERAMTAGLGVVLVAEAVLRVVVVYASTDPDVVVTGALAQIPSIALIVALFVAIRVLAVPRLRAVVDDFVPGGGADDDHRARCARGPGRRLDVAR